MRAADLGAQVIHEALRLRPRGGDRRLTLAPCAAPLLLGDPLGLRRLDLRGSRPVEHRPGLHVRRADRRERLLEGDLALGQPAAGIRDDRRRQAEPLGNRERLAPAGQPDPEAIRGAERLQVELDGGIADAGRRVGVHLELRVVGRRRDEGARAQEVVEERLGQRGALGGVGAGAQLVEQDERVRTGGLRDPDDRAEVPGERRERLRHGLLVADVGEDVPEDGQPAARVGRHVEPRLVHEREKAERAKGDRLPARVRPGHEERLEIRPQLHVDRNDRPREAGMAGAPQGDLRPRADLGPGCVELLRQARLRAPEVEAGQRPEQLAERPGLAGHERRQLVEDALHLLLLGHLRLAPRVAQLDRDEWLHEQRLAAAGRVVDDPLDPPARLGADGHHVAPVAQRHDRVLECRPHLRRVHQLLQPAPQPLVGQPGCPPEPSEARRCRVEQLPDRIERSLQGGPERRQAVQIPGKRAEQGAAVAGERVAQPRPRFERGGDGGELRRVQAPAARRPPDGGPDVVGAPDPRLRLLREELARLRRLVQPDLDEHPVGRRQQGGREAATGLEPGCGRQPVADERELEERDRLRVHHRHRRPESAGLPRTRKRHARVADSSPA